MGVTPLVILALIIVVLAAVGWLLWKALKGGGLLLAKGVKEGAEAVEHAGEDDRPSHSAKRKQRVEPTWGRSADGGPPLTELTAQSAGALSPFGEDHSFPMPPHRLRYAHPTDKPNRAGLMAREGR
jgi:hypothetical protein